MQPVEGIPGVVRPGCVVEVNEVEPKSGALLGEIRKDDCHNGLLVKSLGITRWAPESLKEDS